MRPSPRQSKALHPRSPRGIASRQSRKFVTGFVTRVSDLPKVVEGNAVGNSAGQGALMFVFCGKKQSAFSRALPPARERQVFFQKCREAARKNGFGGPQTRVPLRKSVFSCASQRTPFYQISLWCMIHLQAGTRPGKSVRSSSETIRCPEETSSVGYNRLSGRPGKPLQPLQSA